MALQGERGSASFFFETEKGRAAVALKAGWRSRSYSTSGMASLPTKPKMSASARAFRISDKWQPPGLVEVIHRNKCGESARHSPLPTCAGFGSAGCTLQRLERR